MINKIMINKLLRNFVFSISVLALFSCATVDKRFADPEDAVHPGVQVFLDYQKSINSESEFDDEMQLFFSEAGRRRIQATQGWNRLVYSSSFRALKWGSCDDISILKQSSNSILVSCKGPFTYRSAFGFSRQETMHLRVNVRKVGQGWYVDTAGMTHTMDGGNSVPRSIGLKFPK